MIDKVDRKKLEKWKIFDRQLVETFIESFDDFCSSIVKINFLNAEKMYKVITLWLQMMSEDDLNFILSKHTNWFRSPI